jgi:hypothetical protein
VRASDVRADIADDARGRGMRVCAYALYDAALAGGAVHVAYYARGWYLLLCATYSRGMWHDVYGARLNVPAERVAAPDLRPSTMYDELVAEIACEGGVEELVLEPSAPVRAARLSRSSEADALAVAMHVLTAARTAPVFPGTHLLADLREFAATEKTELLKSIEDPYERTFTAFHAKLTAFAKVGLVGAAVGAYYGRVLLSLFRMFAGTDLELDAGPLCVLLSVHSDGHRRVADEDVVRELVGRVRDAYGESEPELGVNYIRFVAKFLDIDDASIKEATEELGQLEAAAAKKHEDKINSDAFKRNAGKVVGVAGLFAAGAGAVYVAYLGVAAVSALFTAATGLSSSWLTAGAIATAGSAGLGAAAVVVKEGATLMEYLRSALSSGTERAVREKMSFSSLAPEIIQIVPATELAFYTLEAMIATLTEDEWKPAEKVAKERQKSATALWKRACGNDEKRGKAAQMLQEGFPVIFEEHNEFRGIYWMLVALFVEEQVRGIDAIAEKYQRHAEGAMRGDVRSIGVGLRTNATREQANSGVALGAVPVGAYVYAELAGSGAFTVLRRTTLDSFDEYAVHAHDLGVDLAKNTIVKRTELEARVAQGQRLRGPIYDPNELLGKAHGKLRATARQVYAMGLDVSASLQFTPILPHHFAARLYDTDAVGKYAAFVAASRARVRAPLELLFGTYAVKIAEALTFSASCGLGVVTAAADSAIPASWVINGAIWSVWGTLPVAERGVRGAFRAVARVLPRTVLDQARDEVDRSPSIQAQLSPELYRWLSGHGEEPGGAKEPLPAAVPFDYMSRTTEAMQAARTTLPLAKRLLEACFT